MTQPLIAFLDTLGRAPRMADYEARVAELDVDAPTREALIGRDAGALNRACGLSTVYWCAIVEAPGEPPKPLDDVPGEAPDREPEPQPDPDPTR